MQKKKHILNDINSQDEQIWYNIMGKKRNGINLKIIGKRKIYRDGYVMI